MSKQKYQLPRTIPRLPEGYLSNDKGGTIQRLDNVIRNQSIPIRLTPHVICPCVEPPRQGGSGQPTPDCVSCSGTGYAFVENRSQNVAGVVSGLDADTRQQTDGLAATGQINVVFPSDVTVAELDRLHLYEMLVVVRHARKYRGQLGGIRVPFDVKEVRDLVTKFSDTQPLISLTRGKDYSFSEENNILSFPKTGIVQSGMVISGTFLVAPYYIVSTLPEASRGQYTRAFSEDSQKEWVKMPQEVQAVRSDLLFGRMDREVSNCGSIRYGEGN